MRKYERHGGHSDKKKEYNVYNSMLIRCYNPKHKYYPIYGGRGIVVCERWKNSFLAFYEDMGPRPEGMTLDRKDGNGPYSKDNCRWATIIEQNNNLSTNVFIEYQDKRMTLAMWSREIGVPYDTLKQRYYSGKPIEIVLSPCRVKKLRFELTDYRD